jgi:RNA polymerase sigma-70 factor (ECF subfamily)
MARPPRASHGGGAHRLVPSERAESIDRAAIHPSRSGVFVVIDPSTSELRDPLGRPSALAAGGGRTMSGVWDRDEAAAFVETLFAKHQTEIYAYLLRMMRDPEMAADMTQDAFIKAYKNYDTLEKPENARAWLYQIAHRVALDEIRRRKIIRFLPWTGESKGSAPSAEHLVMDARLSGDMQRALARIPERQRAALLLAELHDLTGLELAAALGVSHVAARALLTRARESLRQALAAERAADAAAEAARDAAHTAGADR